MVCWVGSLPHHRVTDVSFACLLLSVVSECFNAGEDLVDAFAVELYLQAAVFVGTLITEQMCFLELNEIDSLSV